MAMKYADDEERDEISIYDKRAFAVMRMFQNKISEIARNSFAGDLFLFAKKG